MSLSRQNSSFAHMDRIETLNIIKNQRENWQYIEVKPWQRKRHWYRDYLAGIRPIPWPKDERDRDDERYDLREKEYES